MVKNKHNMKNFKELKVWQKAISLVTKIYKATANYPQSEQFGLTSQIRRASVSIPSNIAEGFGRNSDKDFIQFLRISLGSLFEIQTQLEISKNLGFITIEEYNSLLNDSVEIEKMLKAFIKSINK